MLIVASSTAEHTATVAQACLDAGCDYLDILYSRNKLSVLEDFTPRIEESGRCFITEAGFHPGLPAALVRYAAAQFDEITDAIVAGVISYDWSVDLSTSTKVEFVKEILDYESSYYRDERWRTSGILGYGGSRKIDFGEPFKTRLCVPMFFDEMRPLPGMFPSLTETGFWIAGFNWVTDYIVLPIVMVGMRISPTRLAVPMSQMLFKSLRLFGRPPWGISLVLDATGRKNGDDAIVKLRLFHADGYEFTAIPTVACLLQYLDGTARAHGLTMMGHIVDPKRLVADMERMGVTVASTVPSPPTPQ